MQHTCRRRPGRADGGLSPIPFEGLSGRATFPGTGDFATIGGRVSGGRRRRRRPRHAVPANIGDTVEVIVDVSQVKTRSPTSTAVNGAPAAFARISCVCVDDPGAARGAALRRGVQSLTAFAHGPRPIVVPGISGTLSSSSDRATGAGAGLIVRSGETARTRAGGPWARTAAEAVPSSEAAAGSSCPAAAEPVGGGGRQRNGRDRAASGAAARPGSRGRRRPVGEPPARRRRRAPVCRRVALGRRRADRRRRPSLRRRWRHVRVAGLAGSSSAIKRSKGPGRRRALVLVPGRHRRLDDRRGGRGAVVGAQSRWRSATREPALPAAPSQLPPPQPRPAGPGRRAGLDRRHLCARRRSATSTPWSSNNIEDHLDAGRPVGAPRRRPAARRTTQIDQYP